MEESQGKEISFDINFDVNIQGIKAVYNNNDALEFNIKTSQLSFLTISRPLPLLDLNDTFNPEYKGENILFTAAMCLSILLVQLITRIYQPQNE